MRSNPYKPVQSFPIRRYTDDRKSPSHRAVLTRGTRDLLPRVMADHQPRRILRTGSHGPLPSLDRFVLALGGLLVAGSVVACEPGAFDKPAPAFMPTVLAGDVLAARQRPITCLPGQGPPPGLQL
jgi:hypothetical protein